jgi:hypothetical protein
MPSLPRNPYPHRSQKTPIGAKFGRWTVIGDSEPSGLDNNYHTYVPCRCECGTERKVTKHHLLSGRSSSCGCLHKEITVKLLTKHGESRQRLYKIHSGIIQRCYNANEDAYVRYGGRGIRVCDEWLDSYESFRDWAIANGYHEDLQIDRCDNDGNYEPANCRWVTGSENCSNTSRSRRHEAFGEIKCITAWARDPRCIVTKRTIVYRLGCGWDFVKAITTPMRPMRNRPTS